MGRKTIPGIHWDQRHGCWDVDKIINGTRVRKRFGADFEDAQGWLIEEVARLKRAGSKHHRRRTFAEAATHYLDDHAAKASLETEIILLKSLMPYVGETMLDEICVEDFEGDGCTCRDLAVLAMMWGIGELQKDVVADLQEPGGGKAHIG